MTTVASGQSLEVDPLEVLAARIREKEATVAVVGLGYVGLPLLLAIARAGFPVIGVDADAVKVDVLNAGRSDDRGRLRLRDRRARTRGRLQREPRPARRRRRDRALPAHAAHRRRARPHDGPHRRRGRGPHPAARPPGHPGVHHLPRHHRGAAAADPRVGRARRRPGLRPRVLAGADRPRTEAVPPRQHAEGRRRAHRSLPRARHRASTRSSCTRWSRPRRRARPRWRS